MDLKFKINPGHILAVCEGGVAEGGWQETISVSSLCRDLCWINPQGQQHPMGHLLRDTAQFLSHLNAVVILCQ